jgi:hypothetical protein
MTVLERPCAVLARANDSAREVSTASALHRCPLPRVCFLSDDVRKSMLLPSR